MKTDCFPASCTFFKRNSKYTTCYFHARFIPSNPNPFNRKLFSCGECNRRKVPHNRSTTRALIHNHPEEFLDERFHLLHKAHRREFQDMPPGSSPNMSPEDSNSSSGIPATINARPWGPLRKLKAQSSSTSKRLVPDLLTTTAIKLNRKWGKTEINIALENW